RRERHSPEQLQSNGLLLSVGLLALQRRHAVAADYLRSRRFALGISRPFGGRLGRFGFFVPGLFLVFLFLLGTGGLSRRLEVLRAHVAALQPLDHAMFEALLEVAFDARHQVPVVVADQRDRQPVGAGTAGATD